ncbi:restriction endonuclease subunit S [Gordonia asplenii]|nr:restriction endonuclease subunit S [Gordonia asplenii]
MIRGSNLSESISTRLIDQDIVFLPQRFCEEFARSVARRGDLVFTCWGTIGQIGLIDETSKFEKYIVSNKQMRFRPDPRVAFPEFLYYFLSQPSMLDYVRSQSIGSSVPGFNLGQLKQIEVALPDIRDQEAIVDVLGALDDKIAANQKLLAVGQELICTSWDWICREAEGTLPFSSIAEINPRTAVTASRAAYLDMKNLPQGGMLIESWDAREVRSGARFRNGDTLLARITPCFENGKLGFVDNLAVDEVAVGSTEFIVLRPRTNVPYAAPFCVASTLEFRDHAEKGMTGTSGRQRVQPSALGSFSIPVPTTEEMTKFGEVSDSLLRRLGKARNENQVLAQTRDELLPLLMDGRITVEQAERTVEEVL